MKERIKTFFRTHIFKKSEVVRNTVWLSLKDQWNQIPWNGSSVPAVIDSIIEVLVRFIVLLVTSAFLPIGALFLVEQVLKNIIIEVWENIHDKQRISVISSSIAIFIASIIWFVSFIICLPFTLIVYIIRLFVSYKAKITPV